MKALQRVVAGVIFAGLIAISAHAQVSSIDSVVVQPRVFNDVPDAAAIYSGAYPSSITLGETSVSAASGFANRDVWRFSSDGTASYAFSNDDFFQASMTVTLTGMPITPRKEAGFLLNSIGGDGQFIVNTDGHEVVAFGGPFPFYAFPSTFNSGDTVTLGMTYTVNELGQRSIIYSANGVNSPALPFTNLEQGIIDGSTLGGYFQIVNDPANASNAGQAVFGNISILPVVIPEPSTLALLGMGLLPLFWRRRS